jgi:hypothetical protein
MTNPYAADEFTRGGGFWDDKVVTITGAVFKLKPIVQGTGDKQVPWIDPETKEQGIAHILELKGIDAESEKERTEEYSIGQFIPSEGGEQCVHPKKPEKRLDERSLAARFFTALENAGHDNSKLYPKISALVGYKILFKGEPVLLKDGSVKQNKNGYDVVNFLPVSIEGEGAGAAAGAAAVPAGANGLAKKADKTILGLMVKAEGKLTRKDLVKQISKTLAGDKDSNKIVALVVRQDFHKDKPWDYTGTEITIEPEVAAALLEE